MLRMAIRLSEDEFAALAAEAVDSLPEEFRRRMENVSVEVAPRPTREQIGAAGDRAERRTLLGLYHGVPLTHKSVSAPWDWPERIYLFQRNIEAICRTRRQVVDRIRRTVLHEIGHHFGMDEDDLDALGYG